MQKDRASDDRIALKQLWQVRFIHKVTEVKVSEQMHSSTSQPTCDKSHLIHQNFSETTFKLRMALANGVEAN